MDEQTLKVFDRIYNSQDGKELISYIIKLKDNNYEVWKQDGGDVLRGKAICYDEIISLFERSKSRLEVQQVKKQEWL